MGNASGRGGWLRMAGAVGLGVLAACALAGVALSLGGCQEERAEIPHAVAAANGIKPDPVTGVADAPVSRVPKMLEVYTTAVADDARAELDAAAAKADAKRAEAEDKATAAAVKLEANGRTAARRIRDVQDDLERDNAALAAASAAEQREIQRAITDALAAGASAAARARAEGEKNARVASASYDAAMARQAQKDAWGQTLVAGVTGVGNLVGAGAGVPGLGTLLGGVVTLGLGGTAWAMRNKKREAEQTAEENAAERDQREAVVLSIVKAVAALGRDKPELAQELKGYLRDHVTGTKDDLIETLKLENGVIDLVKAPPIKLAA